MPAQDDNQELTDAELAAIRRSSQWSPELLNQMTPGEQARMKAINARVFAESNAPQRSAPPTDAKIGPTPWLDRLWFELPHGGGSTEITPRKLGKTAVAAGQVAGTLAAPQSMAARVALQGTLGAAQGALSDQADPLRGAGWGGAMGAGVEYGAPWLQNKFPKLMDRAAITMGAPGKMQTPGQIDKDVEAFARQRARSKSGFGIPVGDIGAPKARREVQNEAIEAIERRFPEHTVSFRDTVDPHSGLGGVNKTREVEKFVGLNAPVSTMNNLKRSDDIFTDENLALLRSRPAQDAGLATPVNRSTPSRALVPNHLRGAGPSVEDANMPIRTTYQIGRTQAREGKPIYQQVDKGLTKNSWITVDDTPAQQAAIQRSRQFKAAGDQALEAAGGLELKKSHDAINEELSDLYRISDTNENVWRGLRPASLRMGATSGVGGIVGGLLGAPGTGAATGAALGLLASPGNISRLGNLSSTALRLTPLALRLKELEDAMGDDSKPKRTYGPSRVTRREPGK